MLTIHGRTREQKAELTGPADWPTIGKAVKLLGHRIPILANGSIQDWNDVQECLRITKADGIMSCESLLEYPPLFYNHNNHNNDTDTDTDTTTRIGRLQLANEYMDLARQYPPQQGGQGSGIKCVGMHLHRFLPQDLQSNDTLRQQLDNANTMEALQSCLDGLQRLHQEQNHNVAEEKLSWYRRHRDGRQMSPNNHHQQQEQQQQEPMISHLHNSEYNHDQEPGQTICQHSFVRSQTIIMTTIAIIKHVYIERCKTVLLQLYLGGLFLFWFNTKLLLSCSHLLLESCWVFQGLP
jgi:hypothetical protein